MDIDEQISIVIADDSNEFRTILRLFLESTRAILVIGEARDGEEALSLTQALEPDILLLDLRMPKLDGFQVLDQLQTIDASPEVIVLTSHVDLYYERQVLSRGASRYISKGGAPEQLIQIIHEVANAHH
ncbi:MAG: response regulator transcription factor [Caldilineaceae bacterium]|nr:response regulator transcription factor [Caldilineaceae bacterium]